MEFKAWDFSNDTGEIIYPEEGLQYAQITDVSYNEQRALVEIRWHSYLNDAVFRQSLWMRYKSGGATNQHSVRTLRAIAAAGYGKECPNTTPSPEDLIGLGLCINVSIKPNESNPDYPNIDVTEFFSLPESQLADVPHREDQCYTPGE